MPRKDVATELFAYDRALAAKHGNVLLIGIDEAGRGAIAGPIAAAAVILPENVVIAGLNDSKKLSEMMRERIAAAVKEHALAWAYVELDAAFIDEQGINPANIAAMKMAAEQCYDQLAEKGICRPLLHVIDQVGGWPKGTLYPYVMMSKADATSLSVAAASVIVKTHRDHKMRQLATEFPHYDLAGHKGYINPTHMEEMRTHGRVRGLHRFSWRVKGLDSFEESTTNE